MQTRLTDAANEKIILQISKVCDQNGDRLLGCCKNDKSNTKIIRPKLLKKRKKYILTNFLNGKGVYVCVFSLSPPLALHTKG